MEALYHIPEGYWFSPAELLMTSLFHFEDKVHRRNMTRAEAIPLLFDILSIDRWPRLPRTHHLSPHDGAEDIAVSHPTEDTEHPQIASSAVPVTTTESPAPPAPSEGPSTSAAPPHHIFISARDFLISLAERMARTEAIVAQNHTILVQL